MYRTVAVAVPPFAAIVNGFVEVTAQAVAAPEQSPENANGTGVLPVFVTVKSCEYVVSAATVTAWLFGVTLTPYVGVAAFTVTVTVALRVPIVPPELTDTVPAPAAPTLYVKTSLCDVTPVSEYVSGATEQLVTDPVKEHETFPSARPPTL